MLSLVSKGLGFWRSHGTAATLRLVLLKIARPDATFASLSGDARFGTRKEIGARDLIALRFGACTALRRIAVAATGTGRVTLITDSINSGSFYGGVGTALIMTSLLAEARQARLRIVTRTDPARPENFERLLAVYGVRLSHQVEFAFAPFYDGEQAVEVFEDEMFVTTSWWTTAATMVEFPHQSILYLLQEDERMFYAYGDERLRCEQIMKSRSIRFAINSRLLFDHLVSDGFSNIADGGDWFEPAFPKDIFYRRPAPPSGKRRLMFYARPTSPRNLFYFGIELIEEALKRGVIDLDAWEIVLIGKGIPDIVFLGGYRPQRLENLPWDRYAELVGTVDLGLCLMCTPHPSYPPLDLAASGAVAVTNRYEGKTDLHAYSKNIVCGDLELEAMISAMAEGVRLVADSGKRTENHRLNGMQTDWRDAFSNIISRFGTAV